MKMAKKAVSLLLVFMMIVSLFTIVPISASAASEPIVVLFTKPADWGAVNVYGWDSNGDPTNNAWPGKRADYLCENEYGQSVYKAALSGDSVGIVFSDNGGTQTTNIEAVEYGNLYYSDGGNDEGKLTTDYTNVFHPETAATCTEYGYAQDCFWIGDFFYDKNFNEVDINDVLLDYGHNLTEHPAVSSTITKSGNNRYWSCEACGKFFSDANGNNEIAENSWVIPANNVNGECTVTTAEEFKEAVDSSNISKITLGADIEAPKQSFDGNEINNSQSFVITRPEHVTIDLAGHTISGVNSSSSYAIITPTKATTFASGILSLHGADVSIIDSVGTGSISNKHTSSNVVILSNPAKLEVNGIKITGAKSTGIGMYSAGESHVTVDNCVIDCDNPFTGKVGSSNTHSSLTINSGTFTSTNTTTKLIGSYSNKALYCYGEFTINGGTFINKSTSAGIYGSYFGDSGVIKGGKFYGAFADHMAFLTASDRYVKVASVPENSGMPGEYYYEVVSDNDFAATTEYTSTKSPYPKSVFGVDKETDASALILSGTGTDITRNIFVKDDISFNKDNYGSEGGFRDTLIVDVAAGKTVTGTINTRIATVQSTGEGSFKVKVKPADPDTYEVTYDETAKKYTGDFISSKVALTVTDKDGNVKKFSSANAASAISSTYLKDGYTIKLFDNVNYTYAIPGNLEGTIDLNGHTLTYKGSGNYGVQLTSAAKKLSIINSSDNKDGIFDGRLTKTAAICVGTTSSNGKGNLVIGEGVTVMGCVMVCGKSVVDVYGTVKYDTSKDCPFNCNTNYGNAEQVITLYSGSVIENLEGQAIYKPQAGKLIIKDGATINAKSNAILMRQGALEIQGGTFNSEETSAIVIQSGTDKGYPKGVSANITGGTFNSPENVAPIVSSVVSSSTDSPVAEFLKGDVVLSGDVAEDCIADGFELVDDGNGNKVLNLAKEAKVTDGENTDSYNTFAEAVAAAEDGQTVIMNGNVELENAIDVNAGINIDLGGNELFYSSSNNSPAITVKNGNNVSINNGTIKVQATRRGNGPSCVEVEDGATLNLSDVTLDAATQVYLNAGGTVVAPESLSVAITVPDNYILNKTVDEGSATYTAIPAVAKVGDDLFADFNDAVTAADGESTIILLADYEGTYEMNPGQTLVIDKNSFTFNKPTVTGNYAVSESESSGVYTYNATSAVAKVGEEFFAAFDAAVTAANGESVITLLSDYDGVYQMTPGQTLKVAKNGYVFSTPSVEGENVVKYNTENDITTYTTTAAVWEITSGDSVRYVTRLQDAVSNPANGAVVKLLSDTTETRVCIGSVMSGNINLTVDLNGKKLTSNNTNSSWSAFYFHNSISNGNLTIKNGTIEVKSGAANVFHVRAGQTLNLESTLTVDATSDLVQIEGAGATLNTAADMTTTSNYGIVGMGNDAGPTTVNVTGGKVESADAAIYQPQDGTVNISGGTITADCAVYAKCGDINISGGTLTADGAKADYSYNGNGCNPTGDAVIIDSCGYPGGTPSLKVTGTPTITSANAAGIGDYVNGNNEVPEITSQSTSITLPEGEMWIETEITGVYEIGNVFAEVYNGDTKLGEYSNFADAAEAANGEYTIKLYADYNGTYEMTTGQTLIVDKNGFKFNTPSVQGANVVTVSNNDSVYTYAISDAIWEVNNNGTISYTNNIQSVLSNPPVGVNITLLKDTSIGRTCIGAALSQVVDVTIDLGGNKLTSSNTNSSWSAIYFHDRVKDGNLTIKNGTIEVKSGAANVFHVRAGQTLNLESTLTVDATSDLVQIEGAGATLNTAADMTTTSNYGIVGMGSDAGPTTVNVTGGKVESADVAIYQPQDGTVNISDGTITADCAVYAKCGDINISGGTLTADGAKADYSYNGNGCNPTGDAVIIDSCGYPGGTPSLKVTGTPTITSVNAAGIGDYVNGNNEVPVITSQSTSITLPEGEMWIETETAGTYKIDKAFAEVYNGDTKIGNYSNFNDAVEAANGEYTIKLLADYNGTYEMTAGQTLVVDKNGFAFAKPTVPGANIVNVATNGNVTTYTTTAAVWEVTSGDSVKYVTKLQSAVSTPANGATIKLLADTSEGRTCIGSALYNNINITIDLNGHKFTSTNSNSSWSAIYLHDRVNNGSVTIGNGTIEVKSGAANVFHVRAGQTLNLESTLTVDATSDLVQIEGAGATLNTAADMTTTSHYGIVGMGNDAGPTTVNVTGGKVESADVAIYQPQDGTVNISAGTITADCAVYAKCGDINISGGTLTADGAKADYSYNGNGCNPTGDAVIIDSCGYPGGTPSLKITGTPTITSANAAGIGDYVNGNNEVPVITSQSTSITLPEGEMWVETETAGTYKIDKAFAEVYNGDTKIGNYTNFNDAVEAANGEYTIKLLADYNDTYEMTAGQTLIVDKNGYKFNTPTVEGTSVVKSVNTGSVYTYTTSDAVWEVNDNGNVYYVTNIQSVLSNPPSGVYITLLKDTTIGRTCVGAALSQVVDVTIDLGGNKLTSSNTSSSWSAIYFHDRVKDGNLTIKNGTIEVKSGSANVFHVRAGQTLSLDSTLTVDATSDLVQIEGAGATLNTAADMTTTSHYGIVGMGNDAGPTTVNVTGGKVESADVAIYQPQDGTVNISDGKITADCAVYAKCGDINISGGTLTAEGAKADYSYNGNGCNPTGNAVIIDSCGYPGGTPSLKVTGTPTITSANAAGIGDYVNGNNEVPAITSQTTEITLPVGEMWIESETPGTYVIGDFSNIEYNANLALEDNISVKFYISKLVTGTNVSDYKVKYTYKGTTTEVPLSEAKVVGTNSYMIVVADCAAKEMTEGIDINVYYNNGLIKEIQGYSVMKYCENQIKKSASTEELKNLCYSILSYGSSAQTFFDYNTDMPADANYRQGTYTGDVPEEYKAAVTGKCNANINANLTLESETLLHFYFKPLKGATLTFDLTDSEGNSVLGDSNLSVKSVDKGYTEITIAEIAAKNLNKSYTLTVSDGTNTKVVTYSPLSYAYNKQNDSDLGAVARQLYHYWDAANTFFSTKQ